MEKNKNQQKSNTLLRYEREKRGWSQNKLGELIGADPTMISRWERGSRKPERVYQEKLCEVYSKNAIELGFVTDKEITTTNTDLYEDNANLSISDLGITDTLDTIECVINLAWEVWFASRP